ncbi:sigma-70 family RNA polymerase sigma factor [Roseisolibacter agri]|uniref:DNA-directed RNA polymerase sigma-70 factor n=1 Tax=Roseisolibacter agri TaxID=2014610 RepID=A0AA37Q1N1_9BACT|nr:sigma-70 family RNA polymerase sigma factor [Roseisolibacter agri]GLC24904.1 DNA-directed RNA polymerase sigma-70 factor [Roseisolibacter agri]
MVLPPHSPSERTSDSGPVAPPGSVTERLLAWGAGDASAFDALLPTVYAELRRQARRALRRESVGNTLEPTALVHEAYLRLAGQERGQWRSREQFFGIAAQLMRRILVDHARARHAAKRGGAQRVCVTLADGDASGGPDAEEPRVDLLALHDALSRLAAFDARQAHVVELRYFGGLTIDETAAALGLSPATVKREWAVARAWLRRELAGDASGG